MDNIKNFDKLKDVIIIGASAAGCAASVYIARRNLNFKLIAKDIGGEVLTSGNIENYLGFPHTTGVDLVNMFKEHIAANNIVVDDKEVLSIKYKVLSENKSIFTVITKDNNEYESKSIILATGAHPRKLEITGENEFDGRGITYCTVCDGPLFSDKVTATVGGGSAGLESALMMEGIAKKVYLLERGKELKGETVLASKVINSDKIEVIYNAETQEIIGDTMVSGIKYKDTKTGSIKEIAVQGVMVHIGLIPNSGIVPNEVEKNKFGEIVVDCIASTNIPGFFAAGDVTNIPYKQIGVAAGQGISAALSTVEYLNKLKV